MMEVVDRPPVPVSVSNPRQTNRDGSNDTSGAHRTACSGTVYSPVSAWIRQHRAGRSCQPHNPKVAARSRSLRSRGLLPTGWTESWADGQLTRRVLGALGSNPAPATKETLGNPTFLRGFFASSPVDQGVLLTDLLASAETWRSDPDAQTCDVECR